MGLHVGAPGQCLLGNEAKHIDANSSATPLGSATDWDDLSHPTVSANMSHRLQTQAEGRGPELRVGLGVAPAVDRDD